MGEELKKAGKRFGEVVAMMGKNYISSTIANGLTPIFQKIMDQITDDAKDKLGKKEPEKEDKLGDSKGAQHEDLFTAEFDCCNRIYDGWDNSFTAYTLTCVRVGTDKDEAFFTLGRKYQVTYRCLTAMHSKLKKEDDKTIALPPDCRHGSYCCCLTHHDDMNTTEKAMKVYFQEIVTKNPRSKALSDHFYMGENYVIQQRSKAIFDDAFAATQAEVIKGAYNPVIPPFDETEGMIQLLRAVARNEFIQAIREKVPNVPVVKGFLLRGADQGVLTAVDTAVSTAWPPIQSGVNIAKEKTLEILEKKADEIVDKLKPLLMKLLDLVQSKLHKKEEKKEDENKDEKKKKTQIGDFVKNWKFENTDTGKTFADDLIREDAKVSLERLSITVMKAINDAVERRLQEGMKRLLGEKASMEIVQFVIEKLAEQATMLVKRFTNINPLINACKSFFDKRAEVEKKMKEARNADELEKALTEGSAIMWASLPHIGVRLFNEMETLKSQITTEFTNSMTPAAITPLTDAADAMFAEQMKAINSVRTKMILKLKTQNLLAGNENGLAEAIRTTFREHVFQAIQVLVQDAWTSVAAAIVQSAILQVQAKFEETVWPPIKQGLDELQHLIPEVLGKMGLQLEPIAKKVANILIEKGTTFVVTKLIIKLEELLFNQAEKM